MIANNMNDLERMLRKETKKAMDVASAKSLGDMYEETGDYYSQGRPAIYERTGALGDTPKITRTTSSGDEVSFDAYLDQNYVYSTGDNPSMGQVLDLANYGIRWKTKSGAPAKATVGKNGFWERAEKKMEKTLDDTMSQFFDKQ